MPDRCCIVYDGAFGGEKKIDSLLHRRHSYTRFLIARDRDYFIVFVLSLMANVVGEKKNVSHEKLKRKRHHLFENI